MVTLSVIKADTGGYVGHCAVHPEMIAEARRRVADAVGDLLLDGQVATCGDDLSLIMSHEHGVGATEVHAFAWATFVALTGIAKRLGLYGAGQDMLADAFSGNLRGMGPGYAEMEFTERPSEPILLFLADKTEPGAWNLPLFRMFADPFTTAGLVIDAKMHAGFTFEVYDLFEVKRLVFDCPAEMYDLLMYIGAPSRYVVHSVRSKTLGEQAAATSTQRLSLIAGKYVGKDDPVMIVRCQSGLPAVGEVLEPFALPYSVAGCMRGSHPAAACSATAPAQHGAAVRHTARDRMGPAVPPGLRLLIRTASGAGGHGGTTGSGRRRSWPGRRTSSAPRHYRAARGGSFQPRCRSGSCRPRVQGVWKSCGSRADDTHRTGHLDSCRR